MKQLHSIPLWSICLVQIWSTSVLRRLYNKGNAFCICASPTDWLFCFLSHKLPSKNARWSVRQAIIHTRIVSTCSPAQILGKVPVPAPPTCHGVVLRRRKLYAKACHPRNLTQCITYYKSTCVYYNIPASFSQAAIHTSRDANCGLLVTGITQMPPID